MADAGWIKRQLFAEAERVGRSVISRQIQKQPLPLYLKALHRLAALMVYRPLLDRIGCANFRSAYTGGHPISPDVITFFRAIGLNLKQCYGLTEAGGIFQIQPDDEVKPETVGKPLPGVQIRIAEDQEVLVSSRSVFQGYDQDFQATEAAFMRRLAENRRRRLSGPRRPPADHRPQGGDHPQQKRGGLFPGFYRNPSEIQSLYQGGGHLRRRAALI